MKNQFAITVLLMITCSACQFQMDASAQSAQPQLGIEAESEVAPIQIQKMKISKMSYTEVLPLQPSGVVSLETMDLLHGSTLPRIATMSPRSLSGLTTTDGFVQEISFIWEGTQAVAFQSTSNRLIKIDPTLGEQVLRVDTQWCQASPNTCNTQFYRLFRWDAQLQRMFYDSSLVQALSISTFSTVAGKYRLEYSNDKGELAAFEFEIK